MMNPSLRIAVLLLYTFHLSSSFVVVERRQRRIPPLSNKLPLHRSSESFPLLATRQTESDFQNSSDSDDTPWYDNLDILQGGDDDEFLYDKDTFEDWIPDKDKAVKKPEHLTPAKEVIGEQDDEKYDKSTASNRKSPYTDEEEELIAAMGGKDTVLKQSKREEGFLGDCTLKEIARDYSIPICYLADVLCMWKVPVPININDRLGDMVTGEQAFALVEAVHTLDVAALHDRYSNENLLQVCASWDIDLNEAFQFAMKEKWSLPFGVRTNLRVEQEEELLRVFSSMYKEDDEDD